MPASGSSLAMLLSIVFRSPRHRGAGRARHLAVPDRVVADAGAGDSADHRAARSALCRARAARRRTPRLWSQFLLRLSPNDLFGEAMLAVLSPTTRTLGPVFLDQLRGAVMGAPLPLSAKA